MGEYLDSLELGPSLTLFQKNETNGDREDPGTREGWDAKSVMPASPQGNPRIAYSVLNTGSACDTD